MPGTWGALWDLGAGVVAKCLWALWGLGACAAAAGSTVRFRACWLVPLQGAAWHATEQNADGTMFA